MKNPLPMYIDLILFPRQTYSMATKDMFSRFTKVFVVVMGVSSEYCCFLTSAPVDCLISFAVSQAKDTPDAMQHDDPLWGVHICSKQPHAT